MSKLTELTGKQRDLMTERDELLEKQAAARAKVQAKLDATVDELRQEQAKAATRVEQADGRATEKQRQKDKS